MRPQRNVRNAFTQGAQLFASGTGLPLGAPPDFEHIRLVDGGFKTQHILFVVSFDTVVIDPMTDAQTIVKIQNPGHNLVAGVAVRFTIERKRPAKITQHIGAVAGDPGMPENGGHGCVQLRGGIHDQVRCPLALPERPSKK